MKDTAEQPAADFVVLGRISGLYGVRGWVRVFSYTEPREAVLDYDGWHIDRGGEWQRAGLAEGRRHGKSVIARLDGIEDRDQAAELMGCDIAVASDALPPTAEGQYYWRDLEGLKVVHRDGTGLGSVAYIMETGANDVLVTVGGEAGDEAHDKERLIPFVVDEVILDVDLAGGVITVDWEWD